MSWDIDEAEFYETFAEIAADPTRSGGPEDAKRWAWSALDSTQQELRTSDRENRRLRDVLGWVNAQCPSTCAGVCDEALREDPTPHRDHDDRLAHGQAFGAGLEEGARRERERIVVELRAAAAHLDSLVPRDASPVSHQHLRRSRDAIMAVADDLAQRSPTE